MPDSDGYLRKTVILIGAVFAFRVAYALLYPVHLAGDEAYYWDWGRRPALGYFSKPPFIAWLYGLVDWIGGGTLFAVRFAVIFLGTLSLGMTYLLTAKLFRPRTAFLAVLLAVAVPGNCLLSYILTIDAPLVLAWSLCLFFLWKYVRGEQPVLSLLLLFLFLGIGHLSKQMMLLFPFLAGIFLLSGRETRPLLKRPGPWLALIGSLVFLAPPLIWNARNDWITFHHMDSHIGAEGKGTLLATLAERAGGFLEFVGTQIGALSPVTAVLLFMTTVLPLFLRKELTPRLRFLVVFCGVPLVMVLVAAMFQKVQPNWPAVLYIAGIPMVAAWFAGDIDWFPAAEKTKQRLLAIGVTLGLLLCAFFYFGPIVFSLTGNEGHKADPNRRLIGSDRFAAAVQEVREKVPDWEEHFVAVTAHRYNTSWLAFELPDQPRVYHVLRPTVDSQYQVWPGPWEDGYEGKNGLFVLPGPVARAGAGIENSFERVEKLEDITVKFGHGNRTFSVFRGIRMTAPLPGPRS